MFPKFRIIPLTLFALGAVAMTLTALPSDSQTLRERIKARRADNQTQVASAGVIKVSITHDGINRNFLVYQPPGLPSGSLGVVMVFHGGRGSAERISTDDPTKTVADREKFLVVYPNSVSGNWTDGRVSTAGGPDDVGYVRAVIAALQRDFNVDPNRVFGTGLSNGGIFMHKMACSAPGVLRAISPIASNMPAELAPKCTPSRGTPVIMFSGTSDRLMPFEGGEGRAAADLMLSAPGTAEFWARINGCGGASTQDLGQGVDDGTSLTRVSYQGCRAGAVTLYEVNGGGHTWPGSSARSPAISGKVSRDISASSEMARFFQNYGL